MAWCQALPVIFLSTILSSVLDFTNCCMSEFCLHSSHVQRMCSFLMIYVTSYLCVLADFSKYFPYHFHSLWLKTTAEMRCLTRAVGVTWGARDRQRNEPNKPIFVVHVFILLLWFQGIFLIFKYFYRIHYHFFKNWYYLILRETYFWLIRNVLHLLFFIL